MPDAAQFFGGPRDEGPFSLSLRLADELEAFAVLLRPTDVCEAEEIERLWPTFAANSPIPGSKPAESDEPRLLLVQAERKLGEPRFEVTKKGNRVALVFKPVNRIVRLAHDDHGAGGMASPPSLDPHVIDIMEVDVGE